MALNRRFDGFRIKASSADDLIAEDDEGQSVPPCQGIQSCTTLVSRKTEEVRLNKGDYCTQADFHLCLQDLETPLQRHLSSRTLDDNSEAGLKRVAAVRAAPSTTCRFGNDLNDDLTHGFSLIRQASHTK